MNQKVVIVTGGGRGIGREICVRFARDGARVVAASRSSEELEATRRLIEQGDGKCDVIPTDVSKAGDVRELVGSTLDRHGRIDVLVNCAGVAPCTGIDGLDPRMHETILAVNVNGVYHGCREVWPIMKEQKTGVIVNFSSVASVDPFPGLGAYGAAKAWVNSWTKALAEEGKPHGICVFAVAPGAVETRMLRNAFPDFPADQALQPADVAEVVHAVSQPACRYVSGQVIFVRK